MNPSTNPAIPRPGDFVACYFPFDEDAHGAGPKMRPALVIAARRNPATGQPVVLVAYCSSKKLDHTRAGDLLVSSEIECAAAGSRNTDGTACPFRISLRKVQALPYTLEYFPHQPHRRGALARITAKRLAEVARRMQAERIDQNVALSAVMALDRPLAR